MADTLEQRARRRKRREDGSDTRIIIDTFLLAICSGLLVLFMNFLNPPDRGFYCNDPRIQLSVKENTMSMGAVWLICMLVPALLIIGIELLHDLRKHHTEEKYMLCMGFKIPIVVEKIYTLLHFFLFGSLIVLLTTTFLKHRVGRLRPSFIHICQPKPDCSGTAGNKTLYVSYYHCKNPNITEFIEQKDVRLSFPSGDTSFSTFSMTYTILYLEKRFKFKYSNLFKPIVQGCLFLISAVISVFKYIDHKHHWEDIFAGFLIGLSAAFFVVFSKTNLFSKKQKKKRKA